MFGSNFSGNADNTRVEAKLLGGRIKDVRPTQYAVLIKQRDEIMARNLWTISSKPDPRSREEILKGTRVTQSQDTSSSPNDQQSSETITVKPSKVVVGVVGLAHLDGIEEQWTQLRRNGMKQGKLKRHRPNRTRGHKRSKLNLNETAPFAFLASE